MKPLHEYPRHEQARALTLHKIFLGVQVAAKELGILAALKLACDQNDGQTVAVPDGEPLTLNLAWGKSGATPRRLYRLWKQNPLPVACVRDFRSTLKKDLPRDVVAEANRLATLKGVRNNSTAIKELQRRWFAGERLVPELGATGNWREWWAQHHADKPVPAQPPVFPWSNMIFYRALPRLGGAVKRLGTEGVFAGRNEVKHMLRDSSGLAPGEVYTADDIELEIVCIYTETGRLTVCKIYVMMEWGTRRIVGYTLRPGNGLLERDVRNLLLRGLRCCGLCKNGKTHIVLERGTVALSARTVEEFETAFAGRLEIHRTEMIRGHSWAGATADGASGNPRGKGVVEAFAKTIQQNIRLLPGQRGNRYEVQPANLGFVGQHSPPEKGSVAAEAEALAQIVVQSGGAVRLELPLLWSHQLDAAIAAAITAYNAARGHGMQGFHEHTQEWDELIQNWRMSA